MTIKNDAHGELTEQILTNKGYPLVGKIAKQHRFKWIHDPNLSWEAKVVNYSDTRVMHDKMVTLRKRLDDLWSRYKSKYPKRDSQGDELFAKLEHEIFSKINLNPKDLKRFVK